MPHSALQIGEIAARAGISVDTIRYYERRKLIKRTSCSVGGFRLFAPDAVERVKFIKQAQELGFLLDEIREFLTDGDGINECLRVRDLLSSKISEIDERMKKMREFRRVLQSNLTACEREVEEHGKDGLAMSAAGTDIALETATLP
jgi:DNA-binding transcriptional MerR regulator